MYRKGKENANADALSRNSVDPAPAVAVAEGDIQVCAVSAATVVPELLTAVPVPIEDAGYFAEEQRKDPEVLELMRYLEKDELPTDNTKARKLVAQAYSFVLLDGILNFVDPRRDDRKRAFVPSHLRGGILEENYSGPMAEHFSGIRLYKALARHWWWPNMCADCRRHCASCPQCLATVTPNPCAESIPDRGAGHYGPTEDGVWQQACCCLPGVFDKVAACLPSARPESCQDCATAGGRSGPVLGVPESLLTNRGTNLLSQGSLCLTRNQEAQHHCQCDGMVERFNRTLKTILRKHAAKFGAQWDKYLPGVLWAYRNTPHEANGEKPSYLLFGMDCRGPTEAALLPTTPVQLTDIENYREQLTYSLSSARGLAAKSIQAAQRSTRSSMTRRQDHPISKLEAGLWSTSRTRRQERRGSCVDHRAENNRRTTYGHFPCI